MAYFNHMEMEPKCYLQAHHAFGRLPSQVDTCIRGPQISRIHAVIEWQHQAWHLRDLSLNGSLLNGKKLKPAQNYQLKVGDLIQFADTRHPGIAIADLSMPCNLLIPLDSQGRQTSVNAIELSSYHLLPNDQEPELALFYCVERGRWCVESGHPEHGLALIEPLEHGDVIRCGSQQWQLFITQADSATLTLSEIPHLFSDLQFIFDLSLDEETTHLRLYDGGGLMDLDVRSHHEVAMQLARYKAKDYQRGLAEKDQGWVYADRLAAELGVDICHLNILIFRARKQLIQLMPDLPQVQNLFQRRGGRIRLGTCCFKVVKSDHLECELRLASAN